MTEPIDDRKKTEDRGPGGRFAPGNKASPGRPPGRGPVAEMRAVMASDLDKIIGMLTASALAGDMQAIRIILDRTLPALRPIELPVELTAPLSGTLAQQAKSIINAAATGELAPGQAAQIVGALAGVARIVEVDELVARIDALEAAAAARKGSA